jgi:hypothetical protein
MMLWAGNVARSTAGLLLVFLYSRPSLSQPRPDTSPAVPAGGSVEYFRPGGLLWGGRGRIAMMLRTKLEEATCREKQAAGAFYE